MDITSIAALFLAGFWATIYLTSRYQLGAGWGIVAGSIAGFSVTGWFYTKLLPSLDEGQAPTLFGSCLLALLVVLLTGLFCNFIGDAVREKEKLPNP